MLNVRRGDLDAILGLLPGAAAADHLAAQRRRLGGGQHHHRRAHGARPDPAAEARRRPGHRRVPAQQDRGVGPPVMSIRIIKSTDTAAVDALLSPRRDDDAATRKAVAAIVEAVRKGGDAAVARFARKFDGLDGPVEIPRDRVERARRARRRARCGGRSPRRPEHRACRQGAGAATVPRPGRARRHASSSACARSTASAATCRGAGIRCPRRC